MKTLFLSFFTIFSFSLFGQTYVLDQTFGNNGALQLGEYVRVKDGIVTNNTAYFLTGTGLLKINSDGTNFNFTIPTAPNISNFKLINNSIYLYGQIAYNNTNQGVFIAKMDLNGNPDLNFGINGMKIIDFGQTEILSDIVETPNGELLCSGVRYQTIDLESNIIVFKINALTGDLNFSFDSNGYKTFTSNLTGSGSWNWLRGGFIFNYDNGYLLAGHNSQNYISYLTLIKIDGNGNADSSYGVNGYKSIPCSHSASTFEKITIHNNKIYGNYSYAVGSLGTSSNMICYDLINEQTLFDFNPSNYYKYLNSFKIYDNSIYNTYRNPSYNQTDKFYVEKRFTSSGLIDSSFHINGLYSYNSPSLSTYNFQDEANVILKLDNDFLIAGYSKYTYAISPTFPFLESNYEGGTLIKITPGALLGTNNYESNNTTINLFPNPFENEINFEFHTQIKSISVYDLVGRKIIDPKFNINNNKVTVDLTNITNKGTYFIKINTAEDTIITKKIIKN